MTKEEWMNKSIDERLEWYVAQVGSLMEEEGNSGQKTRRQLLQEVKKRIIFDGTPSENRMKEGNKREKRYYAAVYKAYKALPNIDTEQEKWTDMLDEAQKILRDTSS
ncbi:hypothetical protein ACG2F4_12200 [Halalkalibaculum sp. DA3122]|uniref:hypothetical protein n=1 Tax=unclassified Halalkalibaculum TaxID=2964617 RepID=UPI003754C065